jgi:hypothetical protein
MKINRKDLMQMLVNEVVDVKNTSDSITNFIKIVEQLPQTADSIDIFERLVINMSKASSKLRAIYIFYIIHSNELSKAKSIDDANVIIVDLLEKYPINADYEAYTCGIDGGLLNVSKFLSLEYMLLYVYKYLETLDDSENQNILILRAYQKHVPFLHNLIFLIMCIDSVDNGLTFYEKVTKTIKENYLTINNFEDYLA